MAIASNRIPVRFVNVFDFTDFPNQAYVQGVFDQRMTRLVLGLDKYISAAQQNNGEFEWVGEDSAYTGNFPTSVFDFIVRWGGDFDGIPMAVTLANDIADGDDVPPAYDAVMAGSNNTWNDFSGGVQTSADGQRYVLPSPTQQWPSTVLYTGRDEYLADPGKVITPVLLEDVGL